MKVTITSSVSSKLRSHRIEIDEDYLKSIRAPTFKEACVDCETPTAYLIVPKVSTNLTKGLWVAKDDVTILPDVKSNLDRWT